MDSIKKMTQEQYLKDKIVRLNFTENDDSVPGEKDPEVEASGIKNRYEKASKNGSIIAEPDIKFKKAAMSDEKNKRFIKLIPCETTSWLRKHHLNAFGLLSLIAERARRTSGSPEGLEIGEAYIGDYQEAGISTEKQYRIAKDVLVKIGLIKICETNRKKRDEKQVMLGLCQNGATKRATRGTIVKLLNSVVFDINPEYDDDQKGDLGATSGRRTRMNKKEEECIKEKETHKETDGVVWQESDNICDVRKNSANASMPADAGGVCFNNSNLSPPKKKKTLTVKDFSPEVQEVGKIFLEKMQAASSSWIPPDNKTKFLKSIELMMVKDERTPEQIFQVLDWVLADNVKRGTWTGWKDKILKKNPAEYLRENFASFFGKMSAVPEKKERKFAPSSDDNSAYEKLKSMDERAL